MTLTLTRITFLARFWDIEGGANRVLKTVFQLGSGPCGKTVLELTTRCTPTCYSIDQRCTDGSTKRFVYNRADIVGRIEEEYA